MYHIYIIYNLLMMASTHTLEQENLHHSFSEVTSTLSDTIWIFFPSSWHIGNAVLLRMFSFVFFPRKKVNCNSYIILSWFVQTMYFPKKNPLRLNSTSSPAAKPHSSMAYSPDRLTSVAWVKIQWLPYTYTYKINLYSTCRYVVKYIQECIYLMWICIYINIHMHYK